MNILVLESSTTSAKAMLYSAEKGCIAVESKAYEKMYQDTTLHDAESVYMQTMELGNKVCGTNQVNAIAVVTTWHSLLLCDQAVHPISPVYTWAYTGAGDLCRSLSKDLVYKKNYYQKTGSIINASYPFFKLLSLKEKGMLLDDVLIMGQGTYHYYRLTGKRAIMDSMASGTGLFNIHTQSYDSELLAVVGIHEEQLSEVVRFQKTDILLEDAAKLLGIQAGIPVVTAGPDGALNQVGAGALKHGVMTFSMGTSGALRLSIEQPILSENMSTWCYLSPLTWLGGVATSGCCNCVDYYKDQLFHASTSYSDIEKNIDENKDNLPIFLPFLFGERGPGWNDKRTAAILHMKAEHTRYDIYYSVLEGILFNLYQSYLELVKVAGRPEHIRLSGGVLHSAYWTQMCADIFGEQLEIDDNQHSSLLGGAALGLEVLDSSKRIADFTVQTARTVVPDETKRGTYMRRFEQYLEDYRK